jgi:hypothetical protein
MDCSDPTTNQVTAQGMVGDLGYAPVVVRIVKMNGTKVIFTAPTSDPKTTTFEANWGVLDDMWTPCPSTIAPAATPKNLKGAVPVAGATGTLYLSATFLQKNGIPSTDPKWPTRLPEPPAYQPLEIFVNTIMLTATELLDGNYFPNATPINLLDPSMVQPGQAISTTGGPVTLQVSPAAFAAFNLGTADLAKFDAALDTINAESCPNELARALKTITDVVRAQFGSNTKLKLGPVRVARLKTFLPKLSI